VQAESHGHHCHYATAVACLEFDHESSPLSRGDPETRFLRKKCGERRGRAKDPTHLFIPIPFVLCSPFVRRILELAKKRDYPLLNTSAEFLFQNGAIGGGAKRAKKFDAQGKCRLRTQAVQFRSPRAAKVVRYSCRTIVKRELLI
jgi:hypothetical protein